MGLHILAGQVMMTVAVLSTLGLGAVLGPGVGLETGGSTAEEDGVAN